MGEGWGVTMLPPAAWPGCCLPKLLACHCGCCRRCCSAAILPLPSHLLLPGSAPALHPAPPPLPQLVRAGDPAERVVLQFGKAEADAFILDFNPMGAWPKLGWLLSGSLMAF